MSLLDKLITSYPTATHQLPPPLPHPPPHTGGMKTTLLHDQDVLYANAN